jgi:rubrerythrin
VSRSKFLLGGGALLASASGLGAFAPSAFADVVPDGDLAYLRLLIASELLAVDFYGQATGAGVLRRPATAVAHRIRDDESKHYALLAALMTAAGQTPTTAGDIDFSYPRGTFASRHSILSFAKELERMLTGAYIDALEQVQTPGYRETMARILASEAQHHGALAALLGEPVIGKRSSPVRMDAMSNFLDNYES